MTKEETEVLRAILEATTPLSNAKHGTKAGRLLLRMEGAKGTVDAEVEARTGEELRRARRPHKLLERMGVLYLDGEGNTRLTDLGRSLREIPETEALRRRIAEAAIPVLAKYQLRNPVDDPNDEYPADTDIHPYWALWKAASELEWKIHWDECETKTPGLILERVRQEVPL